MATKRYYKATIWVEAAAVEDLDWKVNFEKNVSRMISKQYGGEVDCEVDDKVEEKGGYFRAKYDN